MSVHHTIENNKEAKIRPSKTYQSFAAAAGGHRELNFIEKDVRNYILREVRNVSELEDAKEFGKYLLRMKEKNQNFFFELELEDDQSIKLAFWADTKSRAACEYFEFELIMVLWTTSGFQVMSFKICSRGVNCMFLGLYKDHHMWITIYLDHHFWAEMRRTQRSENMHAFFNNFIMRNSSLTQFFKQYDNCL
ncbi:hypothetical protein Ahy_A01g001258 [Arachis hypogaea]|uniref:Uncharacterized protein n=1 Tax=Arachis hypogaea TaxID=3818 RepID=A0A445EMK2_ARAHY|nr:hypothetical protein Ahy_A01g001258 [Arachis hypogaea]